MITGWDLQGAQASILTDLHHSIDDFDSPRGGRWVITGWDLVGLAGGPCQDSYSFA